MLDREASAPVFAANENAAALDRLGGRMDGDAIFEPLRFRNLTVKNRVFRSNIAGRLDNYDGSGNRARINWELKFARGGVGAILSAHAPVTRQGRIVTNFACIDSDARVPFWRELAARVHEHDCRYILQLSHAGRQRDLTGVDFPVSISASSKPESVHGLRGEAMSLEQIRSTVRAFADGARRAREAGIDGVELHASHGYLISQFLSPASNDRRDDYGGSLENRFRFLREIVEAVRAEVGRDYHVQAKVSVNERNDAVYPWNRRGLTTAESVQMCRWLEELGVDAIHVSVGSYFPHPWNPSGEIPMDVLGQVYGAMVRPRGRSVRNALIFRRRPFRGLFAWWWQRRGPRSIEGALLDDARAVKEAVSIPVICTSGFQSANGIRDAITSGACDAVSIARALIANNDLVQQFASGRDMPERPCSYCNRCAFHVLMDPLGCYDERRFDSREQMIEQVLSVFDPPPFTG